jgi:uncharacterized protein YbjT (DUF2867 family)
VNIVIIGGTGFIGSKLTDQLRALDHEVIAASPANGVNTMTGEGVAEAIEGAYAVVDVSNSRSFKGQAAMDFFKTSGLNILAAETSAGTRHHLALSVVGTDRLQASNYFQAKLAQESLIRASGIPYTIVRCTQFFEFISAIAQSATIGEEVHLSSSGIQPIAADDVVDIMAGLITGRPLNTIVEIAGPEVFRLDDLVRLFLKLNHDPRRVVTDGNADYFGAVLNEQSLIPGSNPLKGSIRFADWMDMSLPKN